MSISRRWSDRACVFGAVLLIGAWWCPVHARSVKAALVIGAILLWWGIWRLLSGKRVLRIGWLALPLLGCIPFLLPGRPLDAAALREDYVKRLKGFDGTTYVWGGESSRGIDCSGLPRRALRDALWDQGCRTLNGRAFRAWLGEWCFDSSALAMRNEYRGRTRSLNASGPLWDLYKNAPLPGDLAVREDGRHVIAYLGNREWIEADPSLAKVHCWISVPKDGGWYDGLSLYRWTLLE